MSYTTLLISVMVVWTLVSGNKVFNVYKTVKTTESRLRAETLSRQEYDQKLSDRLDAIERLLFMEEDMKETLLLTEHLPEIIENVKHISQVTETLNDAVKTTNRTLEQTEAKVDTVSATLDSLENQMKTLEDNLRNVSNDVENKVSTLSKRLDWVEKCKLKITHKSCLSLHECGQTVNGIYKIYPAEDGVAVPVYCDMTTDGGGWTVFQRRQDGTIDFFRDWDAYRHGFGNVDGEFWLGNDLIADLTSGCCHELRVDMGDFDGARRYAHYDNFTVLPESDNYKLAVGGYSGDAGDSLWSHNNMQFTTKDRDHDKRSGNCATWYKGGWWYNSCHTSNLNGLYLRGADTAPAKGVNWSHWRGVRYSLKMTEMKLR